LRSEVVAGGQIERDHAHFATRADLRECAFLEDFRWLEFSAGANDGEQNQHCGESNYAHEPPLTARAFR
jgi:hypothetical protein